MSIDVTAAILDRLAALLPADVAIYDGVISVYPPLRYVVVYGDHGLLTGDGIDGGSTALAYSVQTTCAVTAPMGPLECRYLASAVRNALTDFRPVSDELVSVGQFIHTVSRRPIDDESVPDRHVVSSVDQFSLLGSLS